MRFDIDYYHNSDNRMEEKLIYFSVFDLNHLIKCLKPYKLHRAEHKTLNLRTQTQVSDQSLNNGSSTDMRTLVGTESKSFLKERPKSLRNKDDGQGKGQPIPIRSIATYGCMITRESRDMKRLVNRKLTKVMSKNRVCNISSLFVENGDHLGDSCGFSGIENARDRQAIRELWNGVYLQSKHPVNIYVRNLGRDSYGRTTKNETRVSRRTHSSQKKLITLEIRKRVKMMCSNPAQNDEGVQLEQSNLKEQVS